MWECRDYECMCSRCNIWNCLWECFVCDYCLFMFYLFEIEILYNVINIMKNNFMMLFFYVNNERDYMLICRWKYLGWINKIYWKWVNEY